jgi:hypothetical protein
MPQSHELDLSPQMEQITASHLTTKKLGGDLSKAIFNGASLVILKEVRMEGL